MNSFSAFRSFTEGLPTLEKPMPVLFIGHGSPMNGIEDNPFSSRWKQLAADIPKPAAVLVISAHWFTRGSRITSMPFPQTIHDFGGFPQALFEVQYPAPGSPDLAHEISESVKTTKVVADHDWGLDHGAWTIVKHMYPEAKIPVLQLSIDYSQPPAFHYEMAKELMHLRKKGVLIMGSGNMVHNLRMLAWDKLDAPEYGFDWALALNDKFKKLIEAGDFNPLIHYENLGPEARLAIPTPEHYLPLLYTLGLKGRGDETIFFNDKAVGGSLTMTSVQLG